MRLLDLMNSDHRLGDLSMSGLPMGGSQQDRAGARFAESRFARDPFERDPFERGEAFVLEELPVLAESCREELGSVARVRVPVGIALELDPPERLPGGVPLALYGMNFGRLRESATGRGTGSDATLQERGRSSSIGDRTRLDPSVGRDAHRAGGPRGSGKSDESTKQGNKKQSSAKQGSTKQGSTKQGNTKQGNTRARLAHAGKGPVGPGSRRSHGRSQSSPTPHHARRGNTERACPHA